MNLAIIGCGGMGANHAAMATNAGVNVTVCADAIRKAATTLARHYGAKATTDWEAAITRKDVDIVLITTPTPTHAELVKRAAKAGKHVFCEKPFARTSAQARQALAACEKAGVKLFVGHVVRYFHEFHAMKQQVEAGRIGAPGYAKLYRGGIFPLGQQKWFRDYEQSGGVTFDCMIHDMDWVRYVFGEPERLYCQALLYRQLEGIDYSQVTMRMKSGLIATFIGTWAHPTGFQVKVEICGDNGMIQYDSNDTSITAEKRVVGPSPGMIIPMSADAVSPYQLEWEDFVAWIEGKRKPRVTPQDAIRAVEMGEAALKSAKTRKPVAL